MIIFWVLVFTAIHMSLFWLLYLKLKNPAVVDVGWASVLTLSGWIYLLSAGKAWIGIVSGLLLLIWGLRLGGYLWFSRVRKGEKDKRYSKLSEDWNINKKLGFFLNYQLQGLLAWLVSFSFYFISQRTDFSLWDFLAFGLIVAGLVGESLADFQLQQYKRQPGDPVCKVGLWQYSRHPNYFFDWLAWLGFALIGLGAGWMALISPLTLYLIMVYVTGPITEKGSLESRGEAYRQYQQQTNLFFPNLFRLFTKR